MLDIDKQYIFNEQGAAIAVQIPIDQFREVERMLAEKCDRSPADNWLGSLTGSISDEEAFLEALKYGREFRDSDKPVD